MDHGTWRRRMTWVHGGAEWGCVHGGAEWSLWGIAERGWRLRSKMELTPIGLGYTRIIIESINILSALRKPKSIPFQSGTDGLLGENSPNICPPKWGTCLHVSRFVFLRLG